jgi:preprotein translocase subunit YajC
VLEAAEQASGGSNLLTFLPIILLFAAMYFLLIRPQSKRRREAQQMQSQLAPGDDVQTVGGLFGTVTSIDDEAVTIEAAPGVNLRYTRGAISRVIKQTAAADSDGDADSDSDGDSAGDSGAAAGKSDEVKSDAAKTTEQG